MQSVTTVQTTWLLRDSNYANWPKVGHVTGKKTLSFAYVLSSRATSWFLIEWKISDACEWENFDSIFHPGAFIYTTWSGRVSYTQFRDGSKAGMDNGAFIMHRCHGVTTDMESFLLDRNRAGPWMGIFGDNTDWIGIYRSIQRNLSPINAAYRSGWYGASSRVCLPAP